MAGQRPFLQKDPKQAHRVRSPFGEARRKKAAKLVESVGVGELYNLVVSSDRIGSLFRPNCVQRSHIYDVRRGGTVKQSDNQSLNRLISADPPVRAGRFTISPLQSYPSMLLYSAPRDRRHILHTYIHTSYRHGAYRHTSVTFQSCGQVLPWFGS